MAVVFISYRREETSGEARALFNDLLRILGKNSVFMDVNTIALGHDFRLVVNERLQSCDLMLALVGREWLNIKSSSGRPRLENPDDFVRLEIETALKRNIPVIPVLVQNARMPTEEQLPKNLSNFAYRTAFELSHTRWESDVGELIKRLDLIKAQEPGTLHEIEVATKPPAEIPLTQAPDARVSRGQIKKPWFIITSASLVALLLTAGAILYYKAGPPSRLPSTELPVRPPPTQESAPVAPINSPIDTAELLIANAKVKSLRFFESGFDAPAPGDRIFGNSFERRTSLYIYWQLELAHPKTTRPLSFNIEELWLNSDGTLAKQIWYTSVQEGWTSSWHTHGYGWQELGNWREGRYKVELYVFGRKLAEGSFSIR